MATRLDGKLDRVPIGYGYVFVGIVIESEIYHIYEAILLII
jgi:hypothetical protein